MSINDPRRTVNHKLKIMRSKSSRRRKHPKPNLTVRKRPAADSYLKAAEKEEEESKPSSSVYKRPAADSYLQDYDKEKEEKGEVNAKPNITVRERPSAVSYPKASEEEEEDEESKESLTGSQAPKRWLAGSLSQNGQSQNCNGHDEDVLMMMVNITLMTL